MYNTLLKVPAPGGDLYRYAIKMEREALAVEGAAERTGAHSKKAAKRLGDLYEAAVAAYGATESDLWLDYARWLVQCGKGAGQVYWRATKELTDPDSFVVQYREALNVE